MKGLKIKKFNVILNPKFLLGKRSVVWNGDDDNNKPVSNGIYYYKMQTGGFSKTKK